MGIKELKGFKKAFRKQSAKIQSKFLIALEKLLSNPSDPQLHNHALKGKFFGLKSFNVTGDVRVHYKKVGNNLIFIKIGTHSQLYG